MLMVAPLPREQMSQAVAAIADATEIVLACHVNPDGDALGTLIGLGLALEQLGKRVTYLSADGVPPNLSFLPFAERVVASTDRSDFDLAIVVDAGDLSRVGRNIDTISACPVIMDIDHHVTGGVFGQIHLLDEKAAATGEIVFDLLLSLGVEITLPIAQNLLCALLTDTGSFRFRNVTPRTMAIAGELIGVGADPNEIAESVFENKSYAAQKLLGRALESLRRSEDGRIVWAVLTRFDFLEFDAGDDATDGIINAIRAVQGTWIAVLFREMPSGKIRVSLRAREPYDVSEIARRFGGGGHRLAAGCSLEGPLTAAVPNLVAVVQESLMQSV
ncbi:MAG: bifunctional oligoribonuclease/PAP phosphatase NrnA [Capsulimonadales bacterium]|nr:bifunctional oligoribonuclease/PAP phosphatase NrnA [Capsulimonadales bacterium]